MNLIKIYFIASFMFFNSSLVLAQDKNITWIATAFWKAPQIREFSPVLRADKAETLIKSCQEYQLRTETLTLPGEEDLVVRYRSSDSLSSDGTFVAKFYISQLEESYQIKSDFLIDKSSEKLPFYTQIEAVTSVNIDEKTNYFINVAAGSFTALSRSLNLEDSAYDLEFERGLPIIKIYGKDLACDLFAGRISFEITTSAFVRIKNDAYEKMMEFYLNKIQPDLSTITAPGSSDSRILKAARLGFRFGNHIKDNTDIDTKAIDSQIDNLMNTLFIPGTLKNSAEVLDSFDGKKKEIQIASMTAGKSVKIYLKHQK